MAKKSKSTKGNKNKNILKQITKVIVNLQRGGGGKSKPRTTTTTTQVEPRRPLFYPPIVVGGGGGTTVVPIPQNNNGGRQQPPPPPPDLRNDPTIMRIQDQQAELLRTVTQAQDRMTEESTRTRDRQRQDTDELRTFIQRNSTSLEDLIRRQQQDTARSFDEIIRGQVDQRRGFEDIIRGQQRGFEEVTRGIAEQARGIADVRGEQQEQKESIKELVRTQTDTGIRLGQNLDAILQNQSQQDSTLGELMSQVGKLDEGQLSLFEQAKRNYFDTMDEIGRVQEMTSDGFREQSDLIGTLQEAQRATQEAQSGILAQQQELMSAQGGILAQQEELMTGQKGIIQNQQLHSDIIAQQNQGLMGLQDAIAQQRQMITEIKPEPKKERRRPQPMALSPLSESSGSVQVLPTPKKEPRGVDVDLTGSPTLVRPKKEPPVSPPSDSDVLDVQIAKRFSSESVNEVTRILYGDKVFKKMFDIPTGQRFKSLAPEKQQQIFQFVESEISGVHYSVASNPVSLAGSIREGLKTPDQKKRAKPTRSPQAQGGGGASAGGSSEIIFSP